jgi:transcriptional regulator with XRE-family HTH domain
MSSNETAFDKDAFKRAMGKCLLYLRVTHHMSLEEMGAQIGVTAQQIHKYETGETTVSPIHLQRYATVFNVPVGYFFGEAANITLNGKHIDRRALSIASEIVGLPRDIRIGFYRLAQQINIRLADLEKSRVA